MFRRKTDQTGSAQSSGSITHAAVPDTDAAVAAKMRTLAAQTSNPDRAQTWRQVAAAAEEGRLSPSIRAEFARGTRFDG